MQEEDSESGASMKQLLDPFMELPAGNVAAMLGITPPQRLLNAEPDDPDFVPYVPHQGKRTFLLGDVLTEVSKRSGSTESPEFPKEVATTLEKARAVMKRRVGPKAEWHDENRHRSNEDVPSPSARRKIVAKAPAIRKEVRDALATGSMLGVLVAANTVSSAPTKKRRGAHVKLHSGTVLVEGNPAYLNIAKFSSLDDFLQNAARDDEWLFAIPPKGEGRPYDFLEALMAGDTETPWKAMTYAEYLRAMLDAAIEDEARWIGEAEQELLTQATHHSDS